jgi:hypothetical protein
MPFLHWGSFTIDVANDLFGVASGGQSIALTASGTAPIGAFTGQGDVTCINTTATPGTITTRTAAQMYADLQTAFGYLPAPGFTYLLRITNAQGSGTLTLAAGTGVTFGIGTYSVAANTFRDFICTVNSATSMTWITSGIGTWS